MRAKTQTETFSRSRPAVVREIRGYWELSKPRISLMVTLTGAVGFLMGMASGASFTGLFHVMLGTFLVSAAANTLNQIFERTPDAQMRRTANRPLPTGRISPLQAGIFASVLGVGGVLYVTLFLNGLTGVIASVTLLSYAFVYTPLKRKSTLNTLVGAVPGALPPLGGWTAATGALGSTGWALFAILFFWQLPHFYSIAWLLKQEYARAGFKMLPSIDPTGTRTGIAMVTTSALLIPVSLLPTWLGATGWVYGAVAAGISLGYFACSLWASRKLSVTRTRWVFVSSLLYLPLLLVVMTIDKVPF